MLTRKALEYVDVFHDGHVFTQGADLVVRLRQGYGVTTFALRRLVEAAGVEPASEIAVSRESPCCVRFRMFSPHTLRTDKMRMKLVR